jgi:hypothetical protein
MAATLSLRALAPIVLSLGAALVAASPVAAVDPIHPLNEDDAAKAWPPLNEPYVVVPPAPSPGVVRRTPSPSPTPASEPEPSHGLDVSWPQCDRDLPGDFAFAIVGVNGGRVYSANPCLASAADGPSQLEWAGREVELYANTGNPGPRLSRFWPDGQRDPRACRDDGPFSAADTVDCAYLYGWNAAADSYRTALEAFIAVGWAQPDAEELPWATTWWLDVETANSWRLDRRLNVATLEGAKDYLVSMDVAEVGFYSTPRMWERLVGSTDAFADHPAWHAGATDEADARRRCADESAFTGGELRMVQWVEDRLDHNLRCEDE